MEETRGNMNNVMKGISLYAMKNRSPAVTLETSLALSLVSCDCPLIFSSIDRPSFSHQCTSGLQQISTRWTSDDWQKHFEQQHDSIISEVTSFCESAASSGCCPFGCHVIEEHGHKAPVQSKENNHSRRESGLAQKVMNSLKADKDYESAQKLSDPLTGTMRIAHNKQHQVERAEKNLILHLSSCHLSELQFMLSMGHEIVSSLHSSSSCPIHQPNKVALADYDLEEEDKSVMKCDAKDVKVAHILKEHQKDLIVAARYVRSVVESSLGQGHLGSCSLCSEKITSLEWGMQHYAHLHSREIMNKNLKMIKRQMEERSLAAVPCPFSSTSHASSCCVVVKKQHRLYSHLDRDHSSEISLLAASLALIGGHRKKKILVDHLKLPIISSPAAVKDDSVDMEEPEIEHLCLCCSVLSGQNTGLPQISSSLDRAYHDSLPACADHIVNDHKDLLLALTSFTSSIIGETSSPFMSCPLHPCAAVGGGDGFRAVFGGRAELYDHLVTRHVDHLMSILRVALVIVQSSLLNSPSIKCPISSCHEASTFHSGMDLLIHLMRNHGQQLLKHSNHSAMGTRITSSAAGRSTNSPLQQEEFGLLSDAKEAEVDVSFSFTSSKDQEGKKAAAKDEVAVAAALIASKLTAKKREAKETTGDFGLKAEALEHDELI